MNPADWGGGLLLALQSSAVSDQVDLNTVLITIVLALCGWTLIEVHRHAVTLGRVMERVWGSDGKGGHAGDIEKLKSDMQAIQGAIADIRAVLRMKRRRVDARMTDADEETIE